MGSNLNQLLTILVALQLHPMSIFGMRRKTWKCIPHEQLGDWIL